MERLTVEQAASRLNLSKLAVRELMRQGDLPIGKVIHHTSRDSFYIYSEMIDSYLRKEVTG